MRTSWPPSARAMPRRRSSAATSGGVCRPTLYLGIDCRLAPPPNLSLIAADGGLLLTCYQTPTAAIPYSIVLQHSLTDLRAPSARTDVHPAERASPATARTSSETPSALDFGVVETVAHFTAARHFQPGRGFHPRHRRAGHQVLQASATAPSTPSCSTRPAPPAAAPSLKPLPARWATTSTILPELGLLAARRSNLGSRCTVFMNSSVKQAQKDGAGVDDISAGLSISRRQKRALQGHPRRLAENSGSTSWCRAARSCNDAVLRAFESELGAEVVRPAIAGLMGAYGAALHAMARAASGRKHRCSALEDAGRTSPTRPAARRMRQLRPTTAA
ncbi:MAG: hypothetical protein ACLUHE_00215 [Christensenellales bacterium]